jgi:hypothetical protein
MFEPRLTLIPERDGQYSLLSETLVPSDFFSAQAAIVGPPQGVMVGRHAVAIQLPLDYRPRAKAGVKRVLHHRVFDLTLDEGAVVTAYVTLDDKVLGTASLIVTSRRVGRLASADRSLGKLDATVELTQELCQAIVVEAAPDPGSFSGPSQQLFELGVVDAPRARFHRLAIRRRLQEYGYAIGPNEITSGPEVQVDVCRDSVFENAT